MTFDFGHFSRMDNQTIADVIGTRIRPNFQNKVYIKDIQDEQLKAHIQRSSRTVSPCTYESQEILAEKIIQRIRLMLKHHQGKRLEDFKDFDFQVYTSRSNTLREQTRSRLANPALGCIPPNCSTTDIQKYTETRVHLYQNSSRENERHENLLKDAEDNLDKLFLIIADEAHWGITGTRDGSIKAHDKLINTWDADKYKNVIVLMVTATPYNLLTEETRLPLDYFCAEVLETGELVVVKSRQDENVEKLLDENGVDITDVVGPKKPLHHVKWTEIYSAKLERGLKIKIRSLVTSSASGFIPMYVGPQQNCKSEFVPFAGNESLEDELALIVKGKNDKVQLFDMYQRQLVVRRSEDGDDYTVGFTSIKALDSYFEMKMNFGEDVFSLCPIMAASFNCQDKLSLYFDKNTKSVKVHTKPQEFVLGKQVLNDLTVTDLFFIDSLEDMDSPGSNIFRYFSLNYYYNTIWKEKTEEQMIRCEESFEELCQTMLQVSDTRKNVYDQTDVFVSEYCIFILALSEFDELLSSGDATDLSTKDMMKEIQRVTQQIGNKLDLFRSELKAEKYVFGENFIKEKAIGDVLDHYRSSIDDSFKDCAGFWKSILKSCLFGHVEGISKRMGKVSDYSDVGIQDIRNLKHIIINSHETGKIISDVMKMTVDDAGRLQGYMKVIRVSEVDVALKLYKSLDIARNKAYDSSTYLFEILGEYGKETLQKIHQSESSQQNYKLHLLLQQQRCASNKKGKLCTCKEYVSGSFNESEGYSVKCVKCGHYHNPVAMYGDLEGLPCILILVDKGKMGDTFPPTFNCIDLRIDCSVRKVTGRRDKSDYVLSTMVNEFGRLCRYNKAGDHHNVPYALVPKNMMQYLQGQTTFTGEDDGATNDGRATIYSNFLRGRGQIDRHTNKPKLQKNVFKIDLKAAQTNFDKDNLNTWSNMILLDAEPQCGKTGTYCCVIAKLRKLICNEVSPCDTEMESEGSDMEVDDHGEVRSFSPTDCIIIDSSEDEIDPPNVSLHGHVAALKVKKEPVSFSVTQTYSDKEQQKLIESAGLSHILEAGQEDFTQSFITHDGAKLNPLEKLTDGEVRSFSATDCKIIDGSGGEIYLPNVSLHVPAAALKEPVSISVTQMYPDKEQQELIESAGLSHILEAVVQVCLQPHGQQFLKPVDLLVNNAKLFGEGTLLVYHKEIDGNRETLWTDITHFCQVAEDGVVLSVDQFSIIEVIKVICERVIPAAKEIVPFVTQFLNSRHEPCQFYLYYKEPNPYFSVVIETHDLSHSKVSRNILITSEYTLVGEGSSNCVLVDKDNLAYYYDSKVSEAGTHTLILEECSRNGLHVRVPVLVDSIRKLPKTIKIRRSLRWSSNNPVICEIKNTLRILRSY